MRTAKAPDAAEMMTAKHDQGPEARADIQSGTTPLELRCAGAWVLRAIAELEPRLASLPSSGKGQLTLDASAVTAMDTSGAWLLQRTLRALRKQGRSVQLRGLRPEFEALLQLIASRDIRSESIAAPGLLARIGRQAWLSLGNAFGMLAFLGENAIILLRSLARPGRIRWRAVAYNLQVTGFEALPITGLLSFLMGIVIAYQGAEQLRQFGAFFDRLNEAISLTSFLVGIGKAPVFAVIIALVGCYQGFQVGGSADSVGRQTTLSVVQSVFLVIVTDALFSIVFSWFDL